MGYQTVFFNSISQIPAVQWQQLAAKAGPFLQHAFLQLLETTGCVSNNSGWQPYHLALFDDEQLIAAAPGYLKSDSYGEYVFDQSWANAYHQHNLAYYPKWISAVPFTPVTGPRFLTHPDREPAPLWQQMSDELQTRLKNTVSSLHVLFPPISMATALKQQQEFAQRYSVQFQWHNYGYHSFDDFLGALTSRKRKTIKKARKSLDARDITIERKVGQAIQPADMAFFIRCYQQTYLKRSGHTGYLNEAFFYGLAEQMGEQMLLIIASTPTGPCASALLFFDDEALYGRYWGALENISELHFECCYYQGIAFAIDNKLSYFNPGTQGEHKLIRGFEPIYCTSAHFLYEPVFHDAVKDFLQRETPAIQSYFQQAVDVLPYNNDKKQKLSVFNTPGVDADTITTRTEN